MRRPNRYYPGWLDLVPLLFIGAAFFYVLSQYPFLPQTYPVHFGVSGLPDRFAEKSLGSVLMAPFIGLVVVLPMVFLSRWMGSEEPRRVLGSPWLSNRLTPGEMDLLGDEALEEILGDQVRSLWAINVLIAGQMFYVTYGSIQAAFSGRGGLGALFWVMIAAVTVVAGRMVQREIRLRRRLSELKKGRR